MSLSGAPGGQGWRRRLPFGLTAAVAAFALAYAVRYPLEPWLGERAGLMFYIIPVVGCALFCGWSSAALAAVLAIIAGGIAFAGDGALAIGEALELGVFALVCIGIMLLADQLVRAQTRGSGTAKGTALAGRSAEYASIELERREQHLRSILATVPDAMIVIDEAGLIVSFSAAAEDMFGFTEAEILGENVSILMPSPDRERHDGYLERYFRSGERRIIGIGRVLHACRRDGSTFPIHLHVGEAKVGSDRLFTGFIQDLTERRETESRLAELQAELAHVSRVTAMGTLATALAHELNQPLTAIANYVETSRDLLGDGSPETVELVREALHECAAQSVRAGQIVRRLRDFIARGESERRVESLSRLISEAGALAFVGAGERGIDVAIELDSGCDRVLVDRIQIQQVLLNLIRNAIEAMSDSPVRRLQIGAHRQDEGAIEVVIADSGPGLAVEIGDHLFQPFVSTKATGMGLGLSICHTIVTGHGGRIWAGPSALGGTAFHFTLIDAGSADDEH